MPFVPDADQQAVLDHRAGQMFIRAAPGGGKTAVETEYAVRCLGDPERPISPTSIVGLSFTRSAAYELRRRLVDECAKLGLDAQLPYVGTMSSVIKKLVNLYHSETRRPRLRVLGSGSKQRDLMLKSHQAGAPGSKQSIDDLVHVYERARARNDSPWFEDHEAASPREHDQHELDQLRIFSAYRRMLQEQGLCEFQDINELFLKYLGTEPEFATMLADIARLIVVDEAQDFSIVERQVVRGWLGKQRFLLALIAADMRQMVYSFRGAGGDFIEKLRLQDPAVVSLVDLRFNYRAVGRLIDHANAVQARYADAFGKDTPLVGKPPNVPEGLPVVGCFHQSLDGELKWLADGVLAAIERGVPPERIAVMSRQRRLGDSDGPLLSEVLKEISGEDIWADEDDPVLCTKIVADGLDWVRALSSVGTPDEGLLVRKAFLTAFGQTRTSRKDQMEEQERLGKRKRLDLNELRHLAEHGDSEAARDVVRDFVRRFDLAVSWAHRKATAADQFGAVMSISGLFEGVGALYDNHTVKRDYQRFEERYLSSLDNLAEFLETDESYAIKSDSDRKGYVRPSSSNLVRVVTAHKAKGHEFDVVALAGLNGGIFPSEQLDTDRYEEHRLHYTAVTRARRLLIKSGSRLWPGDQSFAKSAYFEGRDVEIQRDLARWIRQVPIEALCSPEQQDQ